MKNFISQINFSIVRDGYLLEIPINTIFTRQKAGYSNNYIYVSLECFLTEKEVLNIFKNYLRPIENDELLNYTFGDLVRDAHTFDAIIHGCNCFISMGSGIAAMISKKFPEAYGVDKKTEKGSKKKLGGYTHYSYDEFTVINAYTQFYSGAQEKEQTKERSIYIREWAIRKSMRKIKQNFSGKRLALPLIGAGIAGGDWERIEKIILEELIGEDVTIVVWEQDNYFRQKIHDLNLCGKNS